MNAPQHNAVWRRAHIDVRAPAVAKALRFTSELQARSEADLPFSECRRDLAEIGAGEATSRVVEMRAVGPVESGHHQFEMDAFPDVEGPRKRQIVVRIPGSTDDVASHVPNRAREPGERSPVPRPRQSG